MDLWREKFADCSDWIEAALQYTGGTHTLSDIEDGVEAGHFQLWPGKRAVIVTEIVVYPRLKACQFFLAGGDLDELKEMVPCVEAWAKDLGCTRMTLAGRRGWERSFLKGLGYVPKWTVLGKELQNG
ncbi:hypothetical protein BAU07_06525 [Bordetella flabilis]|uniref:N-acetyltransferase domain-containing protein n=1 Tax=Bordetella flabilis TaxID=463014 RepID=A0A193GC13_9BORD|nr:hypothetical protein BAU07_06525 [Bordetella flabilis]